MMANPAVSNLQKNNPKWFPLVKWGNTGQFDRLDLKTFLQQLAHTPVGDELATLTARTDAATANEALAARLDQVAAQFERFANGATELFKRRSGIYAALTGIGMAAFMNVDGFTVVQRLFADQQLAEAVIVTYDRTRLEQLIQAQEKEGGGQVALPVAQAELERQGLPIGGQYFPYCRASSDGNFADPRCKAVTLSMEPTWHAKVGAVMKVPQFWSWLLSILVTGALIGLGAPFWFDIYKKVAALGLPGMSEAARKAISPAASSAQGDERRQGESSPAGPAAPVRPSPEEMADIFLKARSR
jgi:hypothetical protein